MWSGRKKDPIILHTKLGNRHKLHFSHTGILQKYTKLVNETIVHESTNKTMYDHSTNCLKTQKVYLPADKKKYGDFVPAVYGPGDIRLSKAEIIHGSDSNKDGSEEI